MRVLFVAPVEQGSGETITCLHLADNLTRNGHDVLFLASAFASRFLGDQFPDRIRLLGSDGRANRRAWDAVLHEFRPNIVVFADYPLLFFATGAAPLIDDPVWCESLESLPVCLATLDHFGFAQEEMGMFFGPPHLSFHYQKFPAIPKRMHILLPCPMHEPGPVNGRRGYPFRYWHIPIEMSEPSRREVRRRYLQNENDILVFHSVPNWAWGQAERMALSLYRYLGEILDYYLRDLSRPATVVSVNNGYLLQTPIDCSINIVNLEPISRSEFESLLLSSDLVLTENSVSIAMGKAICGLRACATFQNSFSLPELVDSVDGPVREIVLEMEQKRAGAIFPFNVYPIGMVDELKRIILYRDNSLTAAFRALEVFEGIVTKRRLHALLNNDGEREALKAAQWDYVRRLREIGDGSQILQELVQNE